MEVRPFFDVFGARPSMDNPTLASMARCLLVFNSMLMEVLKENGILLPLDYMQYLLNPGPDRYFKRWSKFAETTKQSARCQKVGKLKKHVRAVVGANRFVNRVQRQLRQGIQS